MRRLTWIALAVLGAAMLVVGPTAAVADDGPTKSWRVTITNLTPEGPGAPGVALPKKSSGENPRGIQGLQSHAGAAILSICPLASGTVPPRLIPENWKSSLDSSPQKTLLSPCGSALISFTSNIFSFA